MPHLTLQEVIDRINQNYPSAKRQQRSEDRGDEKPHRPEFYVPRITRRLAGLMFSVYSS
jgi:hypothetical protein